MTRFEHHLEIPCGTVAECLEWRRDVVADAASRSKKLQKDLWRMCAEDVLFFFKGFVDIFEPRIEETGAGEPQILPFIPWPHQEEAIRYADEHLGKRDIRVNKSRAQGASYMYSMIFLHRWLFQSMFKVNIVSKDQDAADNPKDPDSIMWKILYALENLPEWMGGKAKVDWIRSISDHTLSNRRNGSVIRAYACTANVGSGGRAAVFFMDEIAKFPRAWDEDAVTSTQQITRCRIFCSSPYGSDGAYYRLMHDPTASDVIQKMSWLDNPTQNRGMYHVVHGRPISVEIARYGQVPKEYHDKEYWADLKRRLEERGYDLTTGYRSPWYDNECLRTGANPVSIGQELDMKFSGDAQRYFPDLLVDRLVRTQAADPLVTGELKIDPRYPEEFRPIWYAGGDGRFLLWFNPDLQKQPPADIYIVSADISLGLGGTGSSNSSLTVFNARMRRKVASFVTPTVIPYQFAEIALATCNWFRNPKGNPAYLIWEANGPGGEFGKRVQETDFRDFYFRKQKDVLVRRSTNKPGWWTQNRTDFLAPYREALIEGHYVNPDRAALEELRKYQIGTDGQPYHVADNSKADSSGAKAPHADRVVSDALALMAVSELGQRLGLGAAGARPNVNNITTYTAPNDSFAFRRALFLQEQRHGQQKSRW